MGNYSTLGAATWVLIRNGMDENQKTNEDEKIEDWDEEQWKKHWAEQRRGHQKRLERLHREARHGKMR